MDRETMRSITVWSLWASVHHEPVPSQLTAAGSCAQVTRPGTTPRGTPSGDVGSNKEEGRLLAAAIDRANCRRVISICLTPPCTKIAKPPLPTPGRPVDPDRVRTARTDGKDS